MAYIPIIWKNKEESAVSPLNAENLNHMDDGIMENDNQISIIKGQIENVPPPANIVKDWRMNSQTGVIDITWADGKTQRYDLNIEKIPVSFEMTPDGVITMITSDGTRYTADLKNYIKPYKFLDSEVIDVVENGNNVTFNVKTNSITDEMLESGFLSACITAKEQAEGYASAAATKAKDASDSADEAHLDTLRTLDYCERAENSAKYIDEAITNKTPHFDLNFSNGHLEYTGAHFLFNVDNNGHFIWSII